MLNRLRATYHEFPSRFWVLALASFIDRVGGTLIFPFFALYITQKFGVGMARAGVLIGIFAFFGLLGNMLGGALTDRFGRRKIVLFGLIFSAISSVSLGLVNQLWALYPLAVVVGLLSDLGEPAKQAMVADLLPEEKRSEGFGVLRVAGNLAWILGPTIGGFMAARSYLLLFVLDAVSSLITAGIVYRSIPETLAPRAEAEEVESMMQTFIGYRKVIADRLYMAYIGTSMLMLVVYIQMYNTLSVYLRDEHGITPQGYGFLLTMSAVTVILFQFSVTRRVRRYPPMLMLAMGSILYMVGFGMYGIVAAFPLFIVAMVIITAGEMIVMPVGQALAANFAPAEMRGRYLAVFSLAWTLPATVGPWAAGLILDNFNPDLVWYLGALICFTAALGFSRLHLAAGRRLPVPELLDAAAD